MRDDKPAIDPSYAAYVEAAARLRQLVANPIHDEMRHLVRVLDSYEAEHPDQPRHDAEGT
jgi:hypothetical protein